MTTTDFTTTLLVDQSAREAFTAINNVRGWWSEEIEERTDQAGAEFNYHYQDVHICKLKITELVPDKKVTWLVLDNYFNFTEDETEWTNTTISFDIAEKNGKTEIRFTHHGLTPEYECFDICQDGWTNYIRNSLYKLITTGKGEPNPREGGFNQQLIEEYENKNNSITMKAPDFHTSFTVAVRPHEAFRCINSVTQWWTENLEGHSQQLNDEFTVRFDDIHVSTQKLVEFIPDKKVVWLVTDSALNFIADKQEWNNTRIVFAVTDLGGQTRVDFTHSGLSPEIECYDACSNAWTGYIQNSLKKLIETGKGKPEKKK